jgi:HEPN domain-containing protein/predicted nucleotidyltransferase
MAPATRFPPDDPREWLNRARSNLRRAAERSEGVYLEDLCYDAQQAAEKAIKAVFIARGLWFPFVHDLDMLLTALAGAGRAVPAEVWGAAWLTRFARNPRYPIHTVVDDAEHDRAVAAGHVVVRWAEGEVARAGRLREGPTTRYPSPSPTPARGGAPDPALLGQVVERIVTAVGPDRIILFGSGARSAMGPDSDLDLLVVKRGDWSRHEVDVAIRQSLRGLGLAIDLVLATPADLERYGRSIGLVYLPALEEGRVIYQGRAAHCPQGAPTRPPSAPP